MKLITFHTNTETKTGLIDGKNIKVLDTADMLDVIRTNKVTPTGETLNIDDVTLIQPVERPGKVIALGRNYAAHAAEGGSAPPDFPMLFHKTHTSLIGHKQAIILPDPELDRKIDYEGELAIIIGKPCRNVSEADALDYVFGYTVANDVSARGLQRRTSQFSSGKMLDTFGPLGPAIVTADEIDDVHNLGIRTYLNGREMQNSNTSYMIFNVPFTISYISKITTLEPGDVILTGTPEGVGYARTPPVYLQADDEITIEVDQVGVLSNTVQAS